MASLIKAEGMDSIKENNGVEKVTESDGRVKIYLNDLGAKGFNAEIFTTIDLQTPLKVLKVNMNEETIVLMKEPGETV